MTEQTELGPTAEGAVIADIGGDRGALVLYTPQTLCGAEIEISRQGDGHRTHVAVRERHIGQRRVFAAFYPSLHAGDYDLWNLDSRPAGNATIIGGQITTVDWRNTTITGGRPIPTAEP